MVTSPKCSDATRMWSPGLALKPSCRRGFFGSSRYKETTWKWKDIYMFVVFWKHYNLQSNLRKQYNIIIVIYYIYIYLWTPKPWKMKVLGPQYMGHNPPKWRVWVPLVYIYMYLCFFRHTYVVIHTSTCTWQVPLFSGWVTSKDWGSIQVTMETTAIFILSM